MSRLEVLAANGVDTAIDAQSGYTPTPVISHAILRHNKGRSKGLADGIVITPSHNPPEDGGFNTTRPSGGPAATSVTSWIEKFANGLLEWRLQGVKRLGKIGMASPNIFSHDYMGAYVSDLDSVIDMDVIRSSGLKIGADPMGGAAVHYWAAIAAKYAMELTITDTIVDPHVPDDPP